MIALLNGHSLTKKERFVPESQPLNLAERASTTTLTVGPSAPEIGVGDWLQDETDPGLSGGSRAWTPSRRPKHGRSSWST